MKSFKFYDLDNHENLCGYSYYICRHSDERGVFKYKYLARYGKAPIFYALINNQILVGTDNSIFHNNSLIDVQYQLSGHRYSLVLCEGTNGSHECNHPLELMVKVFNIQKVVCLYLRQCSMLWVNVGDSSTSNLCSYRSWQRVERTSSQATIGEDYRNLLTKAMQAR